MNRIMLLLATASAMIGALCALATTARGCDGYAFGLSSCYAAPVVAVQSYAAPVVAYSAPQAVILPQKVQIVRPELRLQVQQAYGYAAPVVAVQKFHAVQKVVAVQQAARVQVNVRRGFGLFRRNVSVNIR